MFCPKCGGTLSALDKYKECHCEKCFSYFYEDHLIACRNSVYLQAVLQAPNLMRIRMQHGMKDGETVRGLFSSIDLTYEAPYYLVRNLDKYSYIKVVRVATEAFKKQERLFE